ncbi:MAG: hypothetical protein AB8B97_24680 [Granulosicoccus sp.]
MGGSTARISNNFSTGWMDIIRFWGLDPLHEFPLHKLANEYATNTADDVRWNASGGSLLQQLNLLV